MVFVLHFSEMKQELGLLELLQESGGQRLEDGAVRVWERVSSWTYCNWKRREGGDIQKRDRERERGRGRLRGQIRKWSSHNNTVSPVTQFQVKPRCMKNFVES